MTYKVYDDNIKSERDATDEEIEEIEIRKLNASSVLVPSQVTMRQARLALLNIGRLGDVDSAIAALPSPQKEIAEIEWEFSSVVFRDRPMINLIAQVLGISDEELDQLFITANTL